MDFTDLYPTSSQQEPLFSPGSTFLATTHRSRIIIRHALSLQILQTFELPARSSPPSSPAGSLSRRTISLYASNAANSGSAEQEQEITSLSFSPDSERILAVCARQNVAYVFQLGSLVDGDGLEATLFGGVERLSRVEWAPSSLPGEGKTMLLAWSELGLRVTVYSLTNSDHRLAILNPKVTAAAGLSGQPTRLHQWSVDNRYMYIVERHNCKDSVAVYDSLSAFSLLARVPAPYPIGGLSVSPSPIKPYFAIFAQALEYALSIHLPPMARPVASLPPSEGESHTEWSSIGLGVRSAEWRPGGGWLAVAGWDGRIRLIDDREWSTILTLEPMRMTPPSANIWQEPPGWIQSTMSRGIIPFHSLRPPQTISFLRPDVKASPPVMGVSLLKWNLDGTLLLVQHANAPCVLLIYAFPLDRGAKDEGVTVLLMSRPVRDVEWHPLHPRRLGWVCGTGGLFSWNGDWVTEDDDGTETVGGLAECIGIPSQPFNASGMAYSPNGESILLTDGGSSTADAHRSDGKFLLVFEARDDAPDEGGGSELSPGGKTISVSRGEDDSQALEDSFADKHSLSQEDSFADVSGDATSFAREHARRASLSAVWEEAEVTGISA